MMQYILHQLDFFKMCLRGRDFNRAWQGIVDLILHGANEADVWSLDYTIAMLVLPRLKYFRDLNALGCSVQYRMEEEHWQKIINKMILAMELVMQDCGNDGEPLTQKERAKQQEGLRLFGKYFRNLWY